MAGAISQCETAEHNLINACYNKHLNENYLNKEFEDYTINYPNDRDTKTLMNELKLSFFFSCMSRPHVTLAPWSLALHFEKSFGEKINEKHFKIDFFPIIIRQLLLKSHSIAIYCFMISSIVIKIYYPPMILRSG